ncbi:MAG: YceI family protein [Pseudomonadota bacterium]
MKIDQGTIRVFTYKEGMLARLAHDLRLTLSKFEIEIDGKNISATFWPESFSVDGTIVDEQVRSDKLKKKDCTEILENMHTQVLHSDGFPTACLHGQISQKGNDRAVVEGTLELVGQKRLVEIQVRRDMGRIKGSVELVPSRWGIKPFSALLGAIRVQDRVLICFDLLEPVGLIPSNKH